jgi:hypothetical protein
VLDPRLNPDIQRLVAASANPLAVEEVRREVATRLRPLTKWRRTLQLADGEKWLHATGLEVIWSVANELDDNPWLHVSAIVQGRVPLPTYAQMTVAKDVFIGPDRMAYSIWAPSSEHVNLRDVLHLWTPVDPSIRPLPDFTRGLGSI